MQKERSVSNQAGFLGVEAILAASIFSLLATALVGAYFYGRESTALSGNRGRAIMLAEEGLEAARNIRDANFSDLTDGAYGLSFSGNKWNLSGSSDVTDIFTRQIIISSIDANRKNVVSNVTWLQNPQRNGLVSLNTRFTNWLRSETPDNLCGVLAKSQGYTNGVCRANASKCQANGQTHLPDGDAYCVASPKANTCCAIP